MTADSLTLSKFKTSRKRKNGKGSDSVPVPEKPVSLNFETQRIFNANKAFPVNQIMVNSSYPEELSFQPTVKIGFTDNHSAAISGETVRNKVGKVDFLKIQVLMLFTIASMGLLIGFFIAFFI